MTTQDTFSSNWKSLRPHLKEQWHALTDGDLTMIDGSRVMLASVLQEKYACTPEQADKEIDQFLDRMSAPSHA